MTSCNTLNIIKQPGIYLREIQWKLVDDNIFTADEVPCISTIHFGVTNYLNTSRKKLSRVPAKSITVNEERGMDFMEIVSDYRADQLHWFDESAGIRTTGNQIYGHAVIGQPAVEIQRHSSNTTFTINLLIGTSGVDHSYTCIILGPSNGLEMGFEEDFVNLCLAPGDCVIKDNCGFHHARFVEPYLHHMLGQRGVRLLFQPP
ncbi:uncharacterized protein LOC144433117 [Glandiceps talaboti]